MRENRIVCRKCETLSYAQSTSRPFALRGATEKYAPDLPFKLEKLFLDITVDPFNKSLIGSVTNTFRTQNSNSKTLSLDQIGTGVNVRLRSRR